MFHWFIIIWRCRLIHNPRLYTSCNIPPSTSHQLWTWKNLWLIKYYRSPYSVLFSTTLNHKLRFEKYTTSTRSDEYRLHLCGDCHLELCLFWRPLVHTSHHTTSCSRNDLCLIGFSFVLKTCLSNITFWYGVSVSLVYSSPFSKLFYV
jgi:hypothetical protein